MNRFRQKPSKEQAIQKIKHYCGYQERCHQEVREKLFSLGVWRNEVDEIISLLIEENYINEERYAKQFAGSKFRMKKWGFVKIKYELKQKKISDYCIKKALAEINVNDYELAFKKLAIEKWASLRGEKNIFIKKRKLNDYLLQKGFETDLIREFMNSTS
ncbi:MAG TPA: regulatory protein RecX [Puia sp.]|nr:regulatory protein RecX [Puia sp.]